MLAKRILGLFLVVPAFVVGCSTADEQENVQGATEQELHSADCPATLEVEVDVPSIPNDATLAHDYERDFVGSTDPKKDAAEQLDMIKPFLDLARADKKVSLKGTVAQACFYKTVDAKTGHANGYSVWLAKTSGPNGALSLRISQQLGTPSGTDQLFYSIPLKSMTKTSIEVDTSKGGRAFAEDTSNGHDGSDGFSIWIGSVKATAKIGS